MVFVVKLPFLDRNDELARLRGALADPDASLVVLYGRRRCGKSTLVQRVAGPRDVYFLADQRESTLQIRSLAEEIGQVFSRFETAEYPSWDAVLTGLHERAGERVNLFLDEFPYLVQSDAALPSVIQRYLDGRGDKRIRFVLCGSSQRMMHGLVLDRSAPLYGRAHEILKIRPLEAGWIERGLKLTADDAVEAYSVWGGVPRYWELAAGRSTMDAARLLVLDRHGVLHEEPSRLLLDDMRSAVQSHSLLSLVGAGCHRMSELAGRMRKPAGSLTRPISSLIDLGYLRRETPWGVNPRSTKRTLYRIGDPFAAFYYRFVEPNRSLLERGRTDAVCRRVREALPGHVGEAWEQLARDSVPFLELAGETWDVASRWWGPDVNGRMMEVDVVAESLDGKALLVGEAKWTATPKEVARTAVRLRDLGARLPGVRDRRPVFAVWTRGRVASPEGVHVVTPKDVMNALRIG